MKNRPNKNKFDFNVAPWLRMLSVLLNSDSQTPHRLLWLVSSWLFLVEVETSCAQLSSDWCGVLLQMFNLYLGTGHEAWVVTQLAACRWQRTPAARVRPASWRRPRTARRHDARSEKEARGNMKRLKRCVYLPNWGHRGCLKSLYQDGVVEAV